MTSIRTRLLVAYVCIILVGFAGLTVISGGQISSAAEADFGERLKTNVVLTARGIRDLLASYEDGALNGNSLQTALDQYEVEVGGELAFYPTRGHSSHPSDESPVRDSTERDDLEHAGIGHEMREIDAAMRGRSILVERPDKQGETVYFTAAPIMVEGRAEGILQLGVPSERLQAIIAGRWLELGLMFLLVTALALGAAFWLARSIIQPLNELRQSALRLAEGEFSHRVHQFHPDEIGEVARAFNDMAQQVESMLEEQRAFASNASHELRTPLTTIRLRTEALRYDSTLNEATAKAYIAEIDEEVTRLANLVQDLTLLSGFDAGRAELGQEQVDMHRFAQSLVHQVTAKSKDRDNSVQISLTMSGEPPLVDASINHLTVVFRNIFDNAIKYSPEGGVVSWEIEKRENGVWNTIRDAGRGIDPVHLPHVFERFNRADKARSRDIPGTGLGLALVKSIVEAYGGQISVESDGVSKGTIVNVYWPERPVLKSGT